MQSNALLKLGALPNAAAVGVQACQPLLRQLRAFGMGSHMSDNDPDVIDRAQKRHLEGKTHSRIPDEAPGWEEVLASDSEAIVKSERCKDQTMKQMQDETLNCLREEMGEGEGGTPGGVQERR